MKIANCCEQGRRLLDFVDWGLSRPFWILNTDACFSEFRYCPFCGRNLAFADVGDLTDLLQHIADYAGPRLRICFDVDGLLAQESGSYANREKFATSVALLRCLKLNGHTIVIQTARYMKLMDGNQWQASLQGRQELIWWLQEKQIPYDEVYLGKCSSDIYLDDRGCRVNGSRDIIDWASEFLPVLYEKNADTRVPVRAV